MNTNMRKNISVVLGQSVVTMPYMLISLYFTFFLTDVIGIAALAAGIFTFVVNTWDAINDLMIGKMIDESGSPKKIFNLATIPYILSFILMFSIRQNNIFWLILLYFAGIIFYFVLTGIDISFVTLILKSSKDERELTKLHTIRGVTSLVCVIIISTIAFPAVGSLGGGDLKNGFLYFAMILAVFVSVLLVLYSKILSKQELFQSTKAVKKKIPVKKYFLALKGNHLWIFIVLANILFWIGNASRTQILSHYVKYNFNEELVPLFMFTGFLASMVLCLLSPSLCKRFGVVKTIIGGYGLSIIGFILMAVSKNSLPLSVIGNMIIGAFLMVPVTLIVVLVPEAAKVAMQKTGDNISGFVQSSLNFSQKAGTALGGLVSGVILSLGGYVENAVQTSQSLLSISACVIGVPVIFNIICTVIMLFYNKKKKILLDT